jgi:acyl carrier protein
MTDDVILTRLAEIVSAALFHPVTLTPATTATDVEGWDSLSHTIIMMQVERAFGIRIPVEETFALRDCGALVAFLRPYLAAAGPGA